MNIVAINKAHQSKVNRAVKHLIKYNELDMQRNKADGDGDSKLYASLDKRCSQAFDKYLDVLYELPKREQQNIEKSPLY